MATKAHQVFEKPDLLTSILINLSTRDLLLSQKVCKTWKQTVSNSIKLQKALHFMPESEQRLRINEGGDAFDAATGQQVPKPTTHSIVKIFLKLLAHGSYKQNSQFTPVMKNIKSRKKDSWRRMLICQPPASHVTFHSFIGTKELVEPSGIRLGHVVDELKFLGGFVPGYGGEIKECFISRGLLWPTRDRDPLDDFTGDQLERMKNPFYY